MNESEVPVKAGESYDVWINTVGEKGDGIARVKGFVLFVPNVQTGDYVRIRVTKVLQKVGFAEVVQQLEKPDRVERPRKKFESMTMEELHKEEEPSQEFENSEDFGEELDEE